MRRHTGTLLIVLACFLAALAGVGAGRYLLPAKPTPAAELHEVVHHRLALDATQQARLAALEHRYAIRRRALELELRTANARLAEAIDREHGYGPEVMAAVDRSHLAMGALQKETLAHLFAMRQILRPEQAATFDQAVAQALTESAR